MNSTINMILDKEINGQKRKLWKHGELFIVWKSAVVNGEINWSAQKSRTFITERAARNFFNQDISNE